MITNSEEYLKTQLEAFSISKDVSGNKGPIAALLVINRQALDRQTSMTLTWPLDAENWKTGKQGQVKGLGGPATQRVLARHGITRELASEGGRTSRGSIQLMLDYICLLNELYANGGEIDLEACERFWVSKAQDFFDRKPFILSVDSRWGTRRAIRHIVHQAQIRQKESTGSQFVGTLMQHMVGAKLEVLQGEGKIIHHHSNQNDSGSSRKGDFDCEDMVFHVTNMPGEPLFNKCIDNLTAGLKPVVITSSKGALVLEALIENTRDGAYDGRIDILEFEQFIACNVMELGKFSAAGRKETLHKIIDIYNHLVDTVEKDRSLMIEIGDK